MVLVMAHIDTKRIQQTLDTIFNEDIGDFLRHSRAHASDGAHKLKDVIRDAIADLRHHKPQKPRPPAHRPPPQQRHTPAPHTSTPVPQYQAPVQKSPHGFEKGSITLINAYNQKDESSLGRGDRLRFKPQHQVNFDNNQSYNSLITEVASNPAERVVVGNHGDDGRLYFYRDDGSYETDSTLGYARRQLDACAAKGWMPAELFITGCEGCSEINPDAIKALSLEYPGVTIVVSPTVNTVAEDGRGVYGEYYAFINGHMEKSRYFDLNRSQYGSKGDPQIVQGNGKDADYQYWRTVYADEWRADGMMS